jgi:molecular chaperone GrpE
MSKQVRVPIQVRQRDDGSDQVVTDKQRAAVESEPAVAAPEPTAVESEENAPQRGGEHDASPAQRASAVRPHKPQLREEIEALKEDVETWRDRALRLQAEIENFRKRQRRLAEDRIEEDRARLLRSFLMIADNLERALQAEDGGNSALREGVEVTYRSLKQLLKQEGVERIEAEGEVFDPTWHEAVGTVPYQGVEASRDTVVDVTQAGYRLDGRLLRPARVIVAR